MRLFSFEGRRKESLSIHNQTRGDAKKRIPFHPLSNEGGREKTHPLSSIIKRRGPRKNASPFIHYQTKGAAKKGTKKGRNAKHYAPMFYAFLVGDCVKSNLVNPLHITCKQLCCKNLLKAFRCLMLCRVFFRIVSYSNQSACNDLSK